MLGDTAHPVNADDQNVRPEPANGEGFEAPPPSMPDDVPSAIPLHATNEAVKNAKNA